jgi:hypothetical protein
MTDAAGGTGLPVGAATGGRGCIVVVNGIGAVGKSPAT